MTQSHTHADLAAQARFHAQSADIEDEVTLRRAVSVMEDVLADIADWEDKALAEAVGEVRRDLQAWVDCIQLAATREPQAPPTEQAVAAQRQPIVPDRDGTPEQRRAYWRTRCPKCGASRTDDPGCQCAPEARDEDRIIDACMEAVDRVNGGDCIIPSRERVRQEIDRALAAAPVATDRDSMVPSPSAQPAEPKERKALTGPIGECDKCGRKTWVPSVLGKSCGMRQPNGSRCDGLFRGIQEQPKGSSE